MDNRVHPAEGIHPCPRLTHVRLHCVTLSGHVSIITARRRHRSARQAHLHILHRTSALIGVDAKEWVVLVVNAETLVVVQQLHVPARVRVSSGRLVTAEKAWQSCVRVQPSSCHRYQSGIRPTWERAVA